MSIYDERAKYDDREDKLPKWAKDKLSHLRAKVEMLTEKAAEANPVTDDTHIVTDRYSEFPVPIKGGRRDEVTFFPRKYDGPDYFDVRLDGDELYIQTSGQLLLQQGASNTARLSFLGGTTAEQFEQRKEAIAKGWSVDEIRQDKHLGHIPHRNTLGRTQAEIERGANVAQVEANVKRSMGGTR
jgi:hypothetical protein